MTLREISKPLAVILKADGFVHSRTTWTKKVGDLHHVMQLQGSKGGGGDATLNIGVFDQDCYALIWGSPANYIDEVNCVIRTRVGFLSGPYDVWWRKSEPDTPDDIAFHAEKYGLPFLEKFVVRTALLKDVEKDVASGKAYWLKKLELAALTSLCGDTPQAISILETIKKEGGASVQRATEMLGRLE